MRRKNLLTKLWHLLVLGGLLISPTISAQFTKDDLKPISPALTGNHEINVQVIFNDANTNGVYDAGFALAPIDPTDYGHYSAAVGFYADGLQVRNGGAFTKTNTIIPIPGEILKLKFLINVPAKTYRVYAQTLAMAEPLIIYDGDAAFRNQTVPDGLMYYVAFHNATAQPDYVTVVSFEQVVDGDTSLKSLTSNLGTLAPAFSPTVDEYVLTVPYGTASVNLSAIPNGKGATVAGTGAIELTDGYAYVEIVVTAGDGQTKTIVVEVMTAGGESDASLKSITVGASPLKPAFNRDITTYEAWVPLGSTTANVAALPTFGGATVTGTGTYNLVDGKATATITVKSNDLSNTTVYTVNIFETPFNYIENWDGNGATGEGTEANKWGWASTYADAAWGIANGAGIRFMDGTTTSSPVHYLADGTTMYIGRLFLYRWDGSYAGSTLTLGHGDGSGTAVDGISLNGCTTYSFSGLYEWWNNANQPTYTIKVSTEPTGGTVIASQSYSYPTSTKNRLQPFKLIFTIPSTGKYYIQITQTGGLAGTTGGLIGLAELALGEDKVEAINTDVASFSLSDVNQSKSFTVYGNALGNSITLSAPDGITLDKTSISAEDAKCGVVVTATYNYTKDITQGEITLTSGSLSKALAFTYQAPAVSVYEKAVEVENNGRPYPFVVSSVDQSVASLSIAASEGFSVSPETVSADDFAAGSGSISVNVSSSAAVGATGIITISSGAKVLATVAVKKVEPYTRYYIEQKSSSMVIGNHSTGLYPALTDAQMVASQQFFFRQVEPGVFYIVQDDTYRVMRKVASSTYNTEFGVPSNEAKWTIQNQYPGFATLTNVVTGKLLGSDAPAVDGRLYDDKAYAENGNMEWIISNVSAGYPNPNANLASLSLNVGTLASEFSADLTEYSAILPSGTTSVKPIAVPGDLGAQVTGVDAVDVSSGTGVSTITVLASNGVTAKVYTVNYSVATGIKGTKDASVVVFPSINNGTFTVSTQGNASVVSVFNMAGKLVLKQAISGNSQTVNIANSGIYMVKVETAAGTQVVKVIVKK